MNISHSDLFVLLGVCTRLRELASDESKRKPPDRPQMARWLFAQGTVSQAVLQMEVQRRKTAPAVYL